jgi:hypothetical protein
MSAQTMKAILLAILETIREAGPEGCPSGPLYAASMTKGMTLEQYNAIIDALLTLQVITRSNHVLYAVN